MTISINNTQKELRGWGVDGTIAWFTFTSDVISVTELETLLDESSRIEIFNSDNEKIGVFVGYDKLLNIMTTHDDEDDDITYITARLIAQ